MNWIKRYHISLKKKDKEVRENLNKRYVNNIIHIQRRYLQNVKIRVHEKLEYMKL